MTQNRVSTNTQEPLQCQQKGYGNNAKKARDIVPLTFPKIKPEVGVSAYLLSKLYEREPIRYPQWDIARESIGLDLILAKRQEHLANKRLNDKRQLMSKKRDSFNEQYDDLAQKEAVFQTSFQRFNKFVRENQEKRERADKKILDEKLLQEKRDRDIESVKYNITHLTLIKAQMDQRIKEYRMYEDYLQGVVRQSSMMKNVNDIIIRYEALTESKSFLGERQDKELSLLENARAEMAKLLEEKNLILIGLSNQLSELQTRYESAKSNSLLWETLVSKIQDISIQKTDNIKSVKKASWHTYRNMCFRKGIEPQCLENDLEGQLVFIKKILSEFKKVYLAAKLAHSSEINSIKAEIGSKKRV